MNGIDWLRPGIYDGIPADDYHAGGLTKRPALSASVAKLLIGRSPLHAWHAHPQLNPKFRREESTKFDIGTAAHAMLLQGEDIVAVVPHADWRTRDAREARDAARADARVPLLEGQWEQVREMVAALRAQLGEFDVSPSLLGDGKPEQTVVWDEDGITCKARLDWLRDDLRAIDDLKTIPSERGSAKPDVWTRRSFWTIGADVEAVFHARAVEAITGTWPEFRFLVAECSPPYGLSVVGLHDSVLALAKRKMDYAIRKWGQCLESGQWAGYPREMAMVELDAWQEADLLRLTYAEEIAA